MKRYDLIVIGGGASGLTVAAGAASFGMSVALIEKEAQPGGDCLHHGCVPSKALISAANDVYRARKAAASFGMNVTGDVDWAVVKERIRSAIETIAVHDDPERFRKMGVDVIQGLATFVDEHTVRVTDTETLWGKRMVIATGSRPLIPEIEGVLEGDLLTNETIFRMEILPKRMLVIGAGASGLELAQALGRLGVEVTVVDRGERLLPREDEEVAQKLGAELAQQMTIRQNASVARASRENGHWAVTVTSEHGDERVEVDAILSAAGRLPNSEELQLEQADIKTENGKIVVDEQLRTSVSHIYAVGDVIGSYPFTHAAGAEGKTAVANVVFGLKRKMRYDHMPWVVYTDPELFHLGLTETEARERYGNAISVFTQPLTGVDRAIAEHDTVGLIKMITDKRGYIIGAHALGTGAGEWMQEIVFAKQHRHKIGNLSAVVHPYPIRAGAVQQTADQFWRKTFQSSKLAKLAQAYVKRFR
ncbi:dihydrolipoyl dehydrogenase family protein [Shouchella shacheensis]|uniref:dihydrolipoyl dehydrogenase family protein n=1 Tax=Shouchella shacheensis TaxID=1649580 RepID=UPI0007402978|nr:FAD-dependent oxidoreductase [Shouchella shacheensis]